jgi:hypothetical protein
VYVHPREIDPEHPRLPLEPRRRFKCYANLHTTMPKLQWLCRNYRFTTMGAVAAGVMQRSETGTSGWPGMLVVPTTRGPYAPQDQYARNKEGHTEL